jgi:hypothetical protein
MFFIFVLTLVDGLCCAWLDEGQSKCSQYSLTSIVWCAISSYDLDRMLLVIATCRFCRVCAVQFRGSGMTSGRDSGSCITVIYRATHSMLCSSSSLRRTFLSLPDLRILWTSLRVTFGCSLLWKSASRGHISQPRRTSDRIRQLNSGRFQKKTSVGASNNGRLDEASVCAWAQGSIIPGTFWLSIVYPI